MLPGTVSGSAQPATDDAAEIVAAVRLDDGVGRRPRPRSPAPGRPLSGAMPMHVPALRLAMMASTRARGRERGKRGAVAVRRGWARGRERPGRELAVRRRRAWRRRPRLPPRPRRPPPPGPPSCLWPLGLDLERGDEEARARKAADRPRRQIARPADEDEPSPPPFMPVLAA